MKHIRTLLPHELPKYREHLLRLNHDDRRLRFGFPITDEGIHAFTDGLTMRRDRILAHHDHGQALRVIATAHLSVQNCDAMEMAFSVDAAHRNQGLGRDLFRRGLLWASNRHIRCVHLHFLSDNRSIRHLARQAGMDIHLEAGECEATLVPPPPTPQSRFVEFAVEAQATAEYMKQRHHKTFVLPQLTWNAAT